MGANQSSSSDLASILSVTTLAATRRNQAVHDLLTRSTVQIRDPAKARSGQYITERVEPLATGMPSRLRRVAIIFAYWVLLLAGLVAILASMVAAGLMSPGCAYRDYCSGSERIMNTITGVAFLVMLAMVVALGWKGKLLGARRA